MVPEPGSLWKRNKTPITIAIILIGLWIIWEVVTRIRDILEIGTAAEP